MGASLTPKCYMPIWIPIESPAEKIQRAKDQFAAASLAIAEAEQDTSGKDTDSNGKKDDGIVNKAVSGLVLETGLTPCMKKLSLETTKLMLETLLVGLNLNQSVKERRANLHLRLRRFPPSLRMKRLVMKQRRRQKRKLPKLQILKPPRPQPKPLRKGMRNLSRKLRS